MRSLSVRTQLDLLRMLFGLLVITPALLAQEVGQAAKMGQSREGTPDSSSPAATAAATVEWRFTEPQPDWKPAMPFPGLKAAEVEQTTDALRVTLSEGSRIPTRSLAGGIYVDLPDWRREEWAELVVRTRTTGSVSRMYIGLNPREGVPPAGAAQPSPRAVFEATFQARGGVTPIVRDGSVHTYRIHLDWGSQRIGPWRRVGLQFEAQVPGSIDILSVRVVPVAAGEAQDHVTETIMEVPQLKSDFALFRKALEEAHPALYRYTTKREMDAEFARAEAKLTRPMTILQFRNVLARVLAAIKDGHTGFATYQGDEISTVLDSAKQFPLALSFEAKRAFVLLNQGLDDRVKPGMEVLAINGYSLAKILQRILPNLPQDGDIRTGQMYRLGFARGFHRLGSPGRTGFSEAYRLYIGNPPSFRTTLRDPRTRKTVVVELAGATPAEAAVNAEKNPVNGDVLKGIRTLQVLGEQRSVRYLDGENTAILRIPHFARRSADTSESFPDFLQKAFAGLKSRGPKTLIIDLRGNTGGFDVYPGLLFSYLTSKVFRSNEPSHIKTFQPSFSQYTDLPRIDPLTDPYFGSAAGIWRPAPNGGWLMTEKYPTVGVRKPSENHFEGTVYVLIDGGSFSAASAFCATADFYKRAIFIGEETGGAGGGAGGQDIGPTLPNSHLHAGIPIEAEFSVGYKSNRRRGTLPKYAVTQTIDDLAKGRDTVLEFTRELIRSGKGR